MFNSKFASPIVSQLLGFVEKMKPGYQEKLDREKIAAMFQLNKELREAATGRVYRVFDVQVGSALLIDAQENVQMVDWHTSTGLFKGYVADKWDLVVPETAKIHRAHWELVEAAHA